MQTRRKSCAGDNKVTQDSDHNDFDDIFMCKLNRLSVSDGEIEEMDELVLSEQENGKTEIGIMYNKSFDDCLNTFPS